MDRGASSRWTLRRLLRPVHTAHDSIARVMGKTIQNQTVSVTRVSSLLSDPRIEGGSPSRKGIPRRVVQGPTAVYGVAL